MKKVNENVQDTPVSRGETRLNETENFENVLAKNSVITESEKSTAPSYSAQNSELDSLLSEETTTKADKSTQEKAEQVQKTKPDSQMISSKKAAGIAVQGLQELCDSVAEHSGRQLKFGSSFVKLFSCALAPVIQKYSRYINVDPDNVDLDSWRPELLALGSITALGGSTYMQCRKPIEHVAGGENGDKSEPSA